MNNGLKSGLQVLFLSINTAFTFENSYVTQQGLLCIQRHPNNSIQSHVPTHNFKNCSILMKTKIQGDV